MFILSGIMIPPVITNWRNSAFIRDITKVFESVHSNNRENCISAIGVLYLVEGNVLRPKYIFKNNEEVYKEIAIEEHSILLSDLISDEVEVKKVKEDGYIIVTKFSEGK